MTRAVVCLLCFSLLAACQSTGGLSAADAARNAPPGSDAHGQGVDGLLVGHRLMAAGEYELALRAYLRSAAEQGMNVDVLSALGSANLHLGRLGQAEQLLRRAVELDPSFVPAQNNLGVVLMERGKPAEARVVFQQAFALDSGETDSIRENLRLAIAQSENSGYTEPEATHSFSLVRRGQGQYDLLSSL
ncbi:tetratricopeptide repeat protein [Rhodobacter ferrooxidans]|uniref:TPR repeat-containing protein n=1 Tax=Rhodobacter ferrooxidans TaxID=371731 RepID=C8RXS2_9RHOB|nr:tetratricopeptide repeat protein [Rhodobacter sp. SW2]EEW26320.1 TPR repeat-containing protein [Rhodobacter sp. SW2]